MPGTIIVACKILLFHIDHFQAIYNILLCAFQKFFLSPRWKEFITSDFISVLEVKKSHITYLAAAKVDLLHLLQVVHGHILYVGHFVR